MRRGWTSWSKAYFAASVVLALIAAVRVNALAQRSRVVESGGRPVVVAARPVLRGTALVHSDLRVLTIPAAYAPPGSFSRPSEAAGRVVLADLAAGEAVTDTRLARVRAGPVASLVPPGLRAFAVPTSLPRGSVAPGDLVDVLATYGGGQPRTEVVLRATQVLLVLPRQASSGVGLPVAPSNGRDGPVLVVLVSSEDEERMAFARSFATLDVAIAPAEEGSHPP